MKKAVWPFFLFNDQHSLGLSQVPIVTHLFRPDYTVIAPVRIEPGSMAVEYSPNSQMLVFHCG